MIHTAIGLECAVRTAFYAHFTDEQLGELLFRANVDEAILSDELLVIVDAVLLNPFEHAEAQQVARSLASLAQDWPRLLTERAATGPSSLPLQSLYANARALAWSYAAAELRRLHRLGMILTHQALTLYNTLRTDYVTRARERLWLGRAQRILEVDDESGWEAQVRHVLSELLLCGLARRADCDDEVYELTLSERAELINKFNLAARIPLNDPFQQEITRVEQEMARRRSQRKQQYAQLLEHWTGEHGQQLFFAMKVATIQTKPCYLHFLVSESEARVSCVAVDTQEQACACLFASVEHYLFGYASREIAQCKEGGMVLELERFDELQMQLVEQGVEREQLPGFAAALARFQAQGARLLAAIE